VAIGVFDGVHQGHQRIIKTAVDDAKKLNAQSVVVTFRPHPLGVLMPGKYPPILTGLDLKIRLIERLGVDLMLVINFTREFARTSAQCFIDEVLIKKLNVLEVVVGEGFRFGKNEAGDVDFLLNSGRKSGFKVKSVPLVLVDEKVISSTRIRNLLRNGKIDEAGRILGHYPKLMGKVIQGCGRGRDVGFCTANIETEDKASVPCEGVYAGFVRLNDKKRACVVNIGPCPTFNIKEPRIEAHIIDFNEDIYGNKIEIEIIKNLRGQKKFKDKKALSVQINEDIEQTKKILCAKFTEFSKYDIINRL